MGTQKTKNRDEKEEEKGEGKGEKKGKRKKKGRKRKIKRTKKKKVSILIKKLSIRRNTTLVSKIISLRLKNGESSQIF